MHYSDVTWASCCLNSLATRLFIQDILAAIKENINSVIDRFPSQMASNTESVHVSCLHGDAKQNVVPRNIKLHASITKSLEGVFLCCVFFARVALLYKIGRFHDDVIKWKQFPRYWPFVRGIHRSPVNSPHKGQWRGSLMFSLICAQINGWVNNREAGDLRRHPAHCDVIVMRCIESE